MARDVDRPDCWERLAQQALKQGNHKVLGPRRTILCLRVTYKVVLDCREGLPADEEFRSLVVPIPRHREPRQAAEDAEDR